MTTEERTSLRQDIELLRDYMLIGRSNKFLEVQAVRLIEKHSLKAYDLHIGSSAHDTDEFIFDCESILLKLDD